MVATNAMEYNHLTYTYSGNINDYIRTQVFSNFGFEYALGNKKNQLLVGPEITYGISKHLQTGSPQHLYSIGIKANYLFQKKLIASNACRISLVSNRLNLSQHEKVSASSYTLFYSRNVFLTGLFERYLYKDLYLYVLPTSVQDKRWSQVER